MSRESSSSNKEPLLVFFLTYVPLIIIYLSITAIVSELTARFFIIMVLAIIGVIVALSTAMDIFIRVSKRNRKQREEITKINENNDKTTGEIRTIETLESNKGFSPRFIASIIFSTIAISLIFVMIYLIPEIPLASLPPLSGDHVFFYYWDYQHPGGFSAFYLSNLEISIGGYIMFPILMFILFGSLSTIHIKDKRETKFAAIFNLVLLISLIVIHAIKRANIANAFALTEISDDFSSIIASFYNTLDFLAYYPIIAILPLYVMLLLTKSSLSDWYKLYWKKQEQSLSHLQRWKRAYLVLFGTLFLVIMTMPALLFNNYLQENLMIFVLPVFGLYYALFLAEIIVIFSQRKKSQVKS